MNLITITLITLSLSLAGCGGGGGSSSSDPISQSTTQTSSDQTVSDVPPIEPTVIEPVDALLFGDSIVHLWGSPEIEGLSVKNFGFSGITAAGILLMLEDPELYHQFVTLDPQVIYLAVGANEFIIGIRDYIAPQPGEISSYWYDLTDKAMADYTKLIRELNNLFPQAEIIITDVYPSVLIENQDEIVLAYVDLVNMFIQGLPLFNQSLSYLPTADALLTTGYYESGFRSPGDSSTLILPDFIGHLNPRGYELYSSIVLCDIQSRFNSDQCSHQVD